MNEFLEAVPQARHVDISGAAHTVAGDSNQAFRQAVVDVIKEIS
ncbi:MAG: hypothetical protein SWQ30_10715 [Thermodesulfobacteriota bacterium]|nr:hypothetical protein [Thermodesulfobacteriota bacterium]